MGMVGVQRQIPEGTVFGKWTVIGPPQKTKVYGVYAYPCRCQCGHEQPVVGAHLRNGSTRQCRKCAVGLSPGRPFVDITGQTIGQWLVLKRLGVRERPNADQNQCWLCRCLACGHERRTTVTQLNRRDGCKRCDGIRRRIEPYRALHNAIRYRILNRLDRKKKIYDFTLSYERFLEIIGTGKCHYCHTPVTWAKHDTDKGGAGYHLDRKDNARGYTDDNCVACCVRCNFAKGARYSYEEWWAMTECFREHKLLVSC